MNGLLLSGWRVWVPDEVGNPLYHGRVCFFDADTDEPSNVYSDKELANPIGTVLGVDVNGFLPPNVWLDRSHLYKCQVQRKLQDDPETWETLWTIDDVGEVEDNSGLATATTAFVNSVTELRQLDPGAFDYVYVLGWFTPGDAGTPLVFKWQSNETTNKDDGHWITPSSSPVSGRWEQFFGSYVDVRKFGAIPDTGEYVDDAIVRAMNYAKEPNTKDLSDDTIYKPKQVVFAKSGNYKIGSNLNFNLYRMISAFGSDYVPVSISQGVVFTSDRSVTLTIGYGCKVDADNAIVDENVTLDIVEGSFKYVRPQWWNGNDMLMNIKSACATDNDVDVYGDVSRFSHDVVSGQTIEGKGTLTFHHPVFKFNCTGRIYYKVKVVAPSELMVSNILSLSGPSYIRFYSNEQGYIKSSWFTSEGTIAMNQLLNSYWSSSLTDSQRSGKFLIEGGIVNSNCEANELAVCKFLTPLTLSGRTISNILPENGPELIFKTSSTGGFGVVKLGGTKESLVEWFGAFDKACACTKLVDDEFEATVVQKSRNTYHTGSLYEANVSLKNVTLILDNDFVLNGDVYGCSIGGNHTITFNKGSVDLNGSSFLSTNILINVNGNNYIKVNNCKFTFNLSGWLGIDFGSYSPYVQITGNEFSGNIGYHVTFAGNWQSDVSRIVVANNSGCNMTTEYETKSAHIPTPQKLYLKTATWSNGSISWSYKGTVLYAKVPKRRNLYINNGRVISSISRTQSAAWLSGYSYRPNSKFITNSTYVLLQGRITYIDFGNALSNGIEHTIPSSAFSGTKYFLMESQSGTTQSEVFTGEMTYTNSFSLEDVDSPSEAPDDGEVTFTVTEYPTIYVE